MKAARVCNVPGCPTPTDAGRCTTHRQQAEQIRGSSTERGYTGAGHRTFRAQVLARDPLCTDPAVCTRPSTVADHWPLTRRELVTLGRDPDNPAHGRGLCKQHHDKHTARTSPGGWNANQKS